LGRRPPSVETIADFVLWVEDVVERNGGYFRLGGVDFRAVSGGGGGLVYAARTQRILFYDRGFIDYRAVLGERLELLEYGYHHMRADALRCRLDKHPGTSTRTVARRTSTCREHGHPRPNSTSTTPSRSCSPAAKQRRTS